MAVWLGMNYRNACPRSRLRPVQRRKDLAKLSNAGLGPRELGEKPIHRIHRESLRIVRTPQPLLHGTVFWMLLVPEGFQKVLVTGNATAVFWWTGTASPQTGGTVFSRSLSLRNRAEAQEVVPGVAKIVFVHQNRNLPLGYLLDRDGIFVGHRGIIFEFVQIERRVREDAVAKAELVQVTIGPAHGDLDDRVNPAEVRRLGDDHAAPDGGLDPFQLDAQDAEIVVCSSSPAGARQVQVDHSGEGNTASARNHGQVSKNRPPMLARRLQLLGRSTANALRVLAALRKRPVLTLKQLCETHGMTFPTAAKAMDTLVAAGVAREQTGQRRNRVFVYEGYLKILNEGGEPL